MSGAYEIDYVEFPSIDNISSRQFFPGAFGRSFVTFSPSYRESAAPAGSPGSK
jgi:hypothetical protein